MRCSRVVAAFICQTKCCQLIEFVALLAQSSRHLPWSVLAGKTSRTGKVTYVQFVAAAARYADFGLVV